MGKGNNFVYILDHDGKPLMPTNRYRHVRHLLRNQKAKVVRRTPFTIQLLYDAGNEVQEVILGVDAGHRAVALSAATQQQELFACEVELRKDVKKLLEQRSDFRRMRRKKKRYREMRIGNRANSKNNGWIRPSMEVRVQEELNAIKRAMQILPVTRINIEIGEFDYNRLMELPSFSEPIEPGSPTDYNARQYLLWSAQYRCMSCKGKERDQRLVVTDPVGIVGAGIREKVVLCQNCYDKYISGKKKVKRERALIFPGDIPEFGNVRKYLRLMALQEFGEDMVVPHYGYQTKCSRERIGLSKSFLNDAFVLTGQYDAERLGGVYYYKLLRRHNRMLHNARVLKGGVRKRHQAPYEQFGFRLWDKVRYNGTECYIAGRRSSGYFLLKTSSGEVIHTAAKYDKLELLECARGYIVEKRLPGDTLFHKLYEHDTKGDNAYSEYVDVV